MGLSSVFQGTVGPCWFFFWCKLSLSSRRLSCFAKTNDVSFTVRTVFHSSRTMPGLVGLQAPYSELITLVLLFDCYPTPEWCPGMCFSLVSRTARFLVSVTGFCGCPPPAHMSSFARMGGFNPRRFNSGICVFHIPNSLHISVNKLNI